MVHFLVVAVICLAVWTVLAVPAGMLVGRRLRRVGPPAPPRSSPRRRRRAVPRGLRPYAADRVVTRAPRAARSHVRRR
ncbi:hypothetical protein [Actinacidiphila acidipaludis]|uniref:Uncharacterized protein n=1 Tax=Actinacidiphila acidipaludis TaxID=2873382 RepID=A0ABS7Q5E2_9ACTN|nr:hypothetical protein [Streptomyces acidipaludis]MBY8878380.1 hypothetical protein [Streptomyces acidipaludis]